MTCHYNNSVNVFCQHKRGKKPTKGDDEGKIFNILATEVLSSIRTWNSATHLLGHCWTRNDEHKSLWFFWFFKNRRKGIWLECGMPGFPDTAAYGEKWRLQGSYYRYYRYHYRGLPNLKVISLYRAEKKILLSFITSSDIEYSRVPLLKKRKNLYRNEWLRK